MTQPYSDPRTGAQTGYYLNDPRSGAQTPPASAAGVDYRSGAQGNMPQWDQPDPRNQPPPGPAQQPPPDPAAAPPPPGPALPSAPDVGNYLGFGPNGGTPGELQGLDMTQPGAL